MATFVSDTFTDADATLLPNHTGETGATWTAHPNSLNLDGGGFIIRLNSLNGRGGGGGFSYASGLPAAAEYDVSADRLVKSVAGGWGICGRMNTTASTFYLWRYLSGSATWELIKSVAGVFTSLGTFAQTLTVDQTYATTLEIRDAAKKGYVDGVERVSSTDNAITAADRVGVYSDSASTSTTHIHIDNLSAVDAAAPAGGGFLLEHGLFVGCGGGGFAA